MRLFTSLFFLEVGAGDRLDTCTQEHDVTVKRGTLILLMHSYANFKISAEISLDTSVQMSLVHFKQV
jgi:hypothetical protein